MKQRIRVEAFSTPGCSKCALAREALKALVDELGPDRVAWREVNVLEELAAGAGPAAS